MIRLTSATNFDKDTVVLKASFAPSFDLSKLAYLEFTLFRSGENAPHRIAAHLPNLGDKAKTKPNECVLELPNPRRATAYQVKATVKEGVLAEDIYSNYHFVWHLPQGI